MWNLFMLMLSRELYWYLRHLDIILLPNAQRNLNFTHSFGVSLHWKADSFISIIFLDSYLESMCM